MTYEQGGSGVGGRAIHTHNGEILTLQDRVDHHLTAALSTIEVTSNNAQAVTENFKRFYKDSRDNPPGKYRSYVIKKNNPANRLSALTQLLDRQEIQYFEVDRSGNQRAFAYQSGQETNVNIEKGDLLIPANQPKAVLTQVLFDPASQLEDSLTYDITAWSLPYAYGLEAYATTSKIESSKSFVLDRKYTDSVNKAYAYVIEKDGIEVERLVSRLLDEGITIRTNPKATTVGDYSFDSGSYIITRGDNLSKDDELVDLINILLKKDQVKINEISTGFVDQGFDLGSNKLKIIKPLNALCLSGKGVNAYGFGQVKYFFDQMLQQQLTVVDQDRFSRVNLSQYNIVILPNGRYQFSESQLTGISEWVSSGGKLIVMEGATNAFADKEGFALKRHVDDAAKDKEETVNKALDLAARYNHYSEQERNNISAYIPGAIISNQMDHTHPLASGLGEKYFSLKTNSMSYPLMTNAVNVAYLSDDLEIKGFVGKRAQDKIKNSVTYAVEEKGSGTVIYMVDNPLFRCFWYNGFRLFSNALFLVN